MKKHIITGFLVGVASYFLCSIVGYCVILGFFLDTSWKVLFTHLLCMLLTMWIVYYKAESIFHIAIRFVSEVLALIGATLVFAGTGIAAYVMDELVRLPTVSQYVHGMLAINTLLFFLAGNISASLLFLVVKGIKKVRHKNNE